MKNFIFKIRYKKLIIFSIIFIPLLILFANLVVNNNYVKSDDNMIAQVTATITESIFNGGVYYNGC